MRNRKEIGDQLSKDRNSSSNSIFKLGLDLLKIELLLDIRDQNEIMISQLNSMKKYSVTI